MGAPLLHLQAKYCLSLQESMTHPCFLLPNLVAVLQICFGPEAFLLPSVPLSYLLSLPSEDCKIPVLFHVWARGNQTSAAICTAFWRVASLSPTLSCCSVQMCGGRSACSLHFFQLETDLMESAMVCSLCQGPCPDLKLCLSSCAHCCGQSPGFSVFSGCDCHPAQFCLTCCLEAVVANPFKRPVFEACLLQPLSQICCQEAAAAYPFQRPVLEANLLCCFSVYCSFRVASYCVPARFFFCCLAMSLRLKDLFTSKI